MRTRALGALSAILVAMWVASPVMADDEQYPDQPRRCIELIKIRELKVLSDQVIAFRTGVRQYHVNTLPHPCPGLDDHSPIMYRTSLDRLCDIDVITLLEDTGFGFTPGASCGLGQFVPMTENEVKQLERSEKERRE